MVEGGREALQMVEHMGAQPVEDALAYLGHAKILYVVGSKMHHSDNQENDPNPYEAGRDYS